MPNTHSNKHRGKLFRKINSNLTLLQIKNLLKNYLKLAKLEINTYGVKPTEVRHLIGRIGEFYCALKVRGTLTHKVNQHGFDVISHDNKKISVKTTAQNAGFIAISERTYKYAHEIMIIQYRDSSLSVIYHGPIEKAVKAARHYPHAGKYELDISTARKLSKKLNI